MADSQRFFTIDELGEMAPPRWMIDQMFEANSLVMIAGPPGSFKSFLVLDWLLCMACGRQWQGRPTAGAKVLYVLGEGRASLYKRIQAWMLYNRPGLAERQALKENFKVTFEVPQLAIKASVDNMLSELSDDGYQPSVVAIDTFARSFVGLDENSQKDTGLWIEQADRLRTLGYTVIFLHHTAKNTEFGLKYRGSSAIMGAMDTAMTMMRDPDIQNGVKLVVAKQKDHDEGNPLYFVRQVLPLPGQKDSSIVLTPTVKVDERFTSEGREMEKAMEGIVVDSSYPSDADRAKRLAKMFPAITEGTWKTRISRYKKDVQLVAGQSVTSSVTTYA